MASFKTTQKPLMKTLSTRRISRSKITNLSPDKIISSYNIYSLDLMSADIARTVIDIPPDNGEIELKYTLNIIILKHNIKKKSLFISYDCDASKLIDNEIAFSLSADYMLFLQNVPKMNKSEHHYVMETFGKFVIWHKFRELFNLSVMQSNTKLPDLPILPEVIYSEL